jgi:hypothetical protein
MADAPVRVDLGDMRGAGRHVLGFRLSLRGQLFNLDNLTAGPNPTTGRSFSAAYISTENGNVYKLGRLPSGEWAVTSLRDSLDAGRPVAEPLLGASQNVEVGKQFEFETASGRMATTRVESVIATGADWEMPAADIRRLTGGVTDRTPKEFEAALAALSRQGATRPTGPGGPTGPGSPGGRGGLERERTAGPALGSVQEAIRQRRVREERERQRREAERTRGRGAEEQRNLQRQAEQVLALQRMQARTRERSRGLGR